MHEVVRAAAAGEPPEWTVAGPNRRAHMTRVAELLGEWAEALCRGPDDVARWRSVGLLHDALRDERTDVLRDRVPPSLRVLPGPLLHGPAAAEQLRVDGVLDGELLRAVAYHTAGDPSFGALGRALYAADFLEPGRSFLPEWRADLRARMPGDLDEVVVEIVRARIANLVGRRASVLPRTLDFWNALVAERS
jgi:2-amino-4-hydroxy-6-hydroxymethyldihydropteridine diphosphokinase